MRMRRTSSFCRGEPPFDKKESSVDHGAAPLFLFYFFIFLLFFYFFKNISQSTDTVIQKLFRFSFSFLIGVVYFVNCQS